MLVTRCAKLLILSKGFHFYKSKQKERDIRESDFPDLPTSHLLNPAMPRISVLSFLSCIFFPSYHIYCKLKKVELFLGESSASKTHSKCICTLAMHVMSPPDFAQQPLKKKSS